MKLKPIMAIVAKTVLPLVTGLVFLACLVGVIALMAGVFEDKIQPEYHDVARRKATPAEKANVYAVLEVSKDYLEEAVGTLRAASRTEISSRVLATIDEIKVRAGTIVQEGDPLVVLDRRALETQLSQTQASLVAAEAAVKRAENDFRRDRQLYEKRTISQAKLDQSLESVKVTRAKLNHAQEAMAEAKIMLSYTTIAAPKPGMIVDRLAEEGDVSRPGDPLLILYDPKSLRLEVPVMENLAVNLKVGDQLDVYIDARDRDVRATVDEIVPQAEAASRSFLVKLKLPRSDDLFEGMFGRLKIPAGRRRHLCLHTATIETIGSTEFVEVIGPDDVIERRYIKTGRLGNPDHAEVLSGLKQNELVIMRPDHLDGL